MKQPGRQATPQDGHAYTLAVKPHNWSQRCAATLPHRRRALDEAGGQNQIFGAGRPQPVRPDETRAGKTTKVCSDGKRRKVRYQAAPLVHGQGGAGQLPLRLLVVAPTPARKRQRGKRDYRQPAYLLPTDRKRSVKQWWQS